ncbi:MAG TPA: hypothetical protein VGB50_10470 [Flavobacterium sp.]|jgi:RsiW-degrading membrane proteinase PrsW (M82 family)
MKISHRIAGIFLLINCAVFLLWLMGNIINVNCYAWLRDVYEVLWHTLIPCLFVIPLGSMFFWHRENYKKKSLFLLLVTISIATILLLLLL